MQTDTQKTRQPVAVMCFSSGAGGMEMSAVRLAKMLSAVCEVVFVCKQGSFAQQHCVAGNYAFECETVAFHSRTFSPAMLIRVRSIIRHKNIHNVIFLGASELKTLYFAFLGSELNVTVWHGTTKSSPKRDPLHRLVYSCVNHHVAISKHLHANVKTIVPDTSGVDYRMIRPSLQVHADDSRAEQRDFVNITHLGRIADGKGQIDAVLACEILYRHGIAFRLNIIGENDGNSYARQLEQTIDQLAYREHVLLRGFVPDVNLFLANTDIFLFPSAGEGMPGAFIEALHHHPVCIAYSNTVFPEFVELGFYLHLAANGDTTDLADCLYRVAANIGAEKLRSAQNAALARSCFDPQRELAEWMDVIE